MTLSNPIVTQAAKNRRVINRQVNPTRVFVDRNRLALFWFLIAAIALLIAVIQPLYLVEKFKQRERVVVIDPAGTYYISPILEFKEATSLHVAQGTLATKALLNSNPTGFDDPEILSRLFLTSAQKKAKQFWKDDQPEFEAKKIHQKVEISKLNILETRENFTLIEVKGQLIRAGIFRGRTFVESPQFRLTFQMVRNPDLTQNNRFPTAVTDFKYENITP
ncbi:MAG: hypothetical protein ACQKBY_08365 [Verrucomicrobiales bacterium]